MDTEETITIDTTKKLNGRYEIKSLIGLGTSSKVYEAIDHQEGGNVAIKIIKNRHPFPYQAFVERRILKTFKRYQTGHPGQNHIVNIRDCFIWTNHRCMTFDMHPRSLGRVLRSTIKSKFTFKWTKSVAIQLCNALQFLSAAEVIHCDLKPENIVLSSENPPIIKLIDFGNACTPGMRLLPYVQTRQYRSPEVLFGLTYDMRIDMWSAGCILAEILIQEVLFHGPDKLSQIKMFVDMLGIPPRHILDEGSFTEKFFDKLPNGEYVLKRSANHDTNEQPGCKNLQKILFPALRRTPNSDNTFSDYIKLRDLIIKMLEYDPQTRITPGLALYHLKSGKKKHVNTTVIRAERSSSMTCTCGSTTPGPSKSSMLCFNESSMPNPSVSSISDPSKSSMPGPSGYSMPGPSEYSKPGPSGYSKPGPSESSLLGPNRSSMPDSSESFTPGCNYNI